MTKFSLIVATLGRSLELARLFDSFKAQTFRSFEIVVVDQNEDDRVKNVVKAYRDQLEILYLTSAKGLSRARNIGLKHANGDIIGFPDDDCWYPNNALECVATHFNANKRISGLTGCSVNEQGAPSQGRWATKPVMVTQYNVWVCATSYTIFLCSRIVKKVGGFDESLGVGSGTPWGAGEEIHYLLQCLKLGAMITYDPTLHIFHPEPVIELNEGAFARARLYNRGLGRVFALNRLPVHLIMYLILRATAGMLVSLVWMDFPRAKYYGIATLERLRGWLGLPGSFR